MFTSTTINVPDVRKVPRHIAIIMDGNGRWAKRRFLPRVAGHRRGLESVRAVTKACVDRGVEFLTLFAFSSENWRRPKDEVSFLMELFMMALEQEVAKLHENRIRLKVIGDLSSFEPKLNRMIGEAEALTAGNKRLTLTIAANYGGRWDILQAVNRMTRELPAVQGAYLEGHLAPYLAMSYAPEPDLFIRTGGEQRISNFVLWQLAYTELYFTDELWPDFDGGSLDRALASYRDRERRFGRTSEQVAEPAQAGAVRGPGGDFS
jgi:undecaprenyl diphosphate synthase